MLLLRDRFRTMVNVMGDALATGIMAHICRKDFVKEGEQVRKQTSVILLMGLYEIILYLKRQSSNSNINLPRLYHCCQQ